jgi:hypothetical protein
MKSKFWKEFTFYFLKFVFDGLTVCLIIFLGKFANIYDGTSSYVVRTHLKIKLIAPGLNSFL